MRDRRVLWDASLDLSVIAAVFLSFKAGLWKLGDVYINGILRRSRITDQCNIINFTSATPLFPLF